MTIMQCFFFFFFVFPDVLYKGICFVYSFELHQLVDAIQMSIHKVHVCLYKEVDKKYTGCNLKTTEPLDCRLIVVHVCVVISLNTVCSCPVFICLLKCWHTKVRLLF